MNKLPHLGVAFLAMITLHTLAAPAPPADDASAIQGTWTPTKAELGGAPLPDALLKTITMTLTDGHYEVFVGDHPDKGTYTLDPATTPKSITVAGTEGPNHGKTFPAIYELDADTLRICYDLSGAARPTEFKTAPNTKLYLVTYTHKKPSHAS